MMNEALYVQICRACSVGDAARRLLPDPRIGHVAKPSIMADDLAGKQLQSTTTEELTSQ
jgi:hypothetical protein